MSPEASHRVWGGPCEWGVLSQSFHIQIPPPQPALRLLLLLFHSSERLCPTSSSTQPLGTYVLSARTQSRNGDGTPRPTSGTEPGRCIPTGFRSSLLREARCVEVRPVWLQVPRPPHQGAPPHCTAVRFITAGGGRKGQHCPRVPRGPSPHSHSLGRLLRPGGEVLALAAFLSLVPNRCFL